ncbi:hypothetical protein FMEAI12_4260051 [Parafrankia sp. Ea1.12]|nr:hypothetical protein FMEAI12_4260051 [Parafrankia sp. Ea1.12]
MRMMMTIQEVSRRTGFTEPTLRYYERVGLFGFATCEPRPICGPPVIAGTSTRRCVPWTWSPIPPSPASART